MSFFFFNDTATTEIYTLSLHDALPISHAVRADERRLVATRRELADAAVTATSHGDLLGSAAGRRHRARDRKSTRLNSSHANISYAVFCLKKKNNNISTYVIHRSEQIHS